MLDHDAAYDPIPEGRRNIQTHAIKQETVLMLRKVAASHVGLCSREAAVKSGSERGNFTRLKAPSPHPWRATSSSTKVPFRFLEPAGGERDTSGTVNDGSSLGLKKV